MFEVNIEVVDIFPQDSLNVQVKKLPNTDLYAIQDDPLFQSSDYAVWGTIFSKESVENSLTVSCGGLLYFFMDKNLHNALKLGDDVLIGITRIKQ
jgi:hypothetical protein